MNLHQLAGRPRRSRAATLARDAQSDRNVIESTRERFAFYFFTAWQLYTRTPPVKHRPIGVFGRLGHRESRGTGAVTVGSELGVPQKSLSKTRAIYSLTNLHMPNWNNNIVVIYAPIEAVKSYIVQTKKDPKDPDEFMFNMHLLFPERFPASDPT
jgi:hypothetical protein